MIFDSLTFVSAGKAVSVDGFFVLIAISTAAIVAALIIGAILVAMFMAEVSVALNLSQISFTTKFEGFPLGSNEDGPQLF